jgi:uncharacterized protein involved in outer membrane biogenesis
MIRGLFRLVVLLAMLAGGGVLALTVALERGALSSRIEALLEAAAGRPVAIGAVALRPALRPTLRVADVALANLPGLAEPQMARIGEVEVTLALPPLLSGRLEIDRLAIRDAAMRFERDAEGRPNWLLGGNGAGSGAGGDVAIAELALERVRIALPTTPLGEVAVERLSLRRTARAAPIEASGRVRLEGEPLEVAATAGPWAGDLAPVRLTLASSSLRLAAEGTVPRRLPQPGWSIALALDAQDPPALAARFGLDWPLPPLGPSAASLRLGPGREAPAITDIRLRTGAADLGRWWDGLVAEGAELSAEAQDGPTRLVVEGRRAGQALRLEATTPVARRLLDSGGAALPVEADLRAGAASLALSGALALAAGRTQLAARLAAPVLASLGPLLGAELPPLRDLDARARLSFPAGRVALAGLVVSAAALDATGELELALAPRPTLRGRIAVRQADLDAIAGDGAAAAATGRVIPAVALPVAALGAADATLALSAVRLTAGGLPWQGVEAQARLASGRLVLDPLSAGLPGGTLAGRLVLDAAAAPPAATLSLRSGGAGIDLGVLHRATGRGIGAEGRLELAAELSGQGATIQALAATLSGELGLAMVEGRLPQAAALRIGPDLVGALLPGGPPREGLDIRCAALRLSAEAGLAESQALLMEGPSGRIDGSLALSLRDETLAARLLPDIRVVGVTVRAPVGIGGTLAAPAVGVEPGAAVAQVLKDSVANRLWRSSTAEWLRGASGASPPGGDCASALRLARLGREGRVPPPPPAPVPLVPRELQGTVQDLLGGVGRLLRR